MSYAGAVERVCKCLAYCSGCELDGALSLQYRVDETAKCSNGAIGCISVHRRHHWRTCGEALYQCVERACQPFVWYTMWSNRLFDGFLSRQMRHRVPDERAGSPRLRRARELAGAAKVH